MASNEQRDAGLSCPSSGRGGGKGHPEGITRTWIYTSITLLTQWSFGAESSKGFSLHKQSQASITGLGSWGNMTLSYK